MILQPKPKSANYSSIFGIRFRRSKSWFEDARKDFDENDVLSFCMHKRQKAKCLRQILMRVSALAINSNDKCGARGLESFFRDVILQSTATAVNLDQILPLILFEVVLSTWKCVATLALLFAQPKTPGSFLLLPVQLRPINHLIKHNIRLIYSSAEFSRNFQCFLINSSVVLN